MIRLSLAFLLLTSGCVNIGVLAADHESLKQEIAAAQARTRCAPKDLAMAEANLAFAELEFDEGDAHRASQHVAVGRDHAKVAGACPAIPVAPVVVAVVAPPVVTPPVVVKPTVTDKDGDGVNDTDDVCPNDPEDLDAFKDGDGCPDLDNDADGVNDVSDRCPMEAEDRDGYMDSDGCPDADNDGDGLADAQDACPNEKGTAASMGCPSRDRDNDGVTDSSDQCPDQPETKNDYNDADGCPDTKPQRVEVTAEQIVIKERINFATGKATILSSSFPVLDDVAQVMKDYPKIKVEIGGHTDNVGDDSGNQRLSKSRADSVFEYLLGKGVSAQRMITIGYGETRPIDTNRTEEGRTNNRRVEFIIVDGGLGNKAPDAPVAPPPASGSSPWN